MATCFLAGTHLGTYPNHEGVLWFKISNLRLLSFAYCAASFTVAPLIGGATGAGARGIIKHTGPYREI